jgi:TRAP-type C4-dicarboxylate transport system permease large subunit
MKKLLTTLIIAGSLFSGTAHAAHAGVFTVSYWLRNSQAAQGTSAQTQITQDDSNLAVHKTGILGAQATALMYLATSQHSENFKNAFYAFTKDNPALAIISTSIACLVVKSFLDEFNKGLAHITTRIERYTPSVVKDNIKLALGLAVGGLIFKPLLTNSK